MRDKEKKRLYSQRYFQMIGMRRPDNWENPYRQAYPGEDRGVYESSEEVAYEAGADAMLEGLFKMAKESPTGKFIIDSNITQVYAKIYDLPREEE